MLQCHIMVLFDLRNEYIYFWGFFVLIVNLRSVQAIDFNYNHLNINYCVLEVSPLTQLLDSFRKNCLIFTVLVEETRFFLSRTVRRYKRYRSRESGIFRAYYWKKIALLNSLTLSVRSSVRLSVYPSVCTLFFRNIFTYNLQYLDSTFQNE
jgi:hypothetical protein